jgi:hypothetical protein
MQLSRMRLVGFSGLFSFSSEARVAKNLLWQNLPHFPKDGVIGLPACG